MKISVYNQKAEVIGDIELSDKIFAVKPTQHLLAEAVRIHQANSRQGTSNTKTRGEVSGGGKKPWKQKGTGRARAGSTRSPIWRHGGVTFGPRANQNWELKLNKKAKTKALFMSLSDKAANNQLFVVDSVTMTQPKTKEFAQLLTGFKKNIENFGKKQMLIAPKNSEAIVRASKNIQSIHTVLASSLNIVDVLTADSLVILKDSLPVIEKIYLKESKKK